MQVSRNVSVRSTSHRTLTQKLGKAVYQCKQGLPRSPQYRSPFEVLDAGGQSVRRATLLGRVIDAFVCRPNESNRSLCHI
jgi:hypothetical protein